jgi:Holliday junction resolvase RusA-like endonuclease
MTAPADRRALSADGGDAAGGWLPASIWEMLRNLVREHLVAEFVVTGEPISKARARFTGSGSRVKAYTPEATKQGELMVEAAFRAAHPQWKMDQRGTFGVFVEFHAATFQRRDVDNMVKLVLDACNGVVWEDDAQVADVLARVERGGTDPRTAVIIYRAAPNGDRPERACSVCGQIFRVYPSSPDRRTCSRKCLDTTYVKARTTVCEGCNTLFDPGPHAARRKYCSPECRQKCTTVSAKCAECAQQFRQWRSIARPPALCGPACRAIYWRKHPTKTRRGTCNACGAPTSRKDVSRCRACKLEASVGRERHPSPPAPVERRERIGATSVRRVTTAEEAQQRLRRTFAFIATSLMAGKNPTLHDIGQHIGLRSQGSVRDIIQQLESLGCLSREKKKPFRFKVIRPLSQSSHNAE